MRALLGLFSVGVGATVPLAVHAEPIAKETLDRYDKASATGKQQIEIIIMATASGLRWANAAVMGPDHGPGIFCEPGKQSLSSAQVVAMLRTELLTRKEMNDKPLGLALLKAFQDDFPCPTNTDLDSFLEGSGQSEKPAPGSSADQFLKSVGEKSPPAK